MSGLVSFILFIALLSGWVFDIPARSESRIIVQSIDLPSFDRLMKSEDNQKMIVVMAAWCAPCREELPALTELFGKYRHQGLRMIGISLDAGDPTAIQPVVDRYKVNFPVYWVGEAAIERYNIRAIPVIFVVKNGKIVEKIIGKQSKKYLDQKILELLK